MNGRPVAGTNGGGNYTEHSGGYIWAILEGPFGIDFCSDKDAMANIHIRFPEKWINASASVYIRGIKLYLSYNNINGHKSLDLRVEDDEKRIIKFRVIYPDKNIKIFKISSESSVKILL